MRRRGAARGLGAVLAALAGCGGDDAAPPDSSEAVAVPVSAGAAGSAAVAEGGRCLVRLHGKSGSGAPPAQDGDVTILSPAGNAEGWGGRQWLYFPEERYAAARDVVAAAVEGCDRVIVDGFSNGAAFAAKLYCRGETFGGRLVGVVVDDPVPDAGVLDCAPASGVDVTLYWTGALAATAKPGWDCAEADWTCEGGTTIGIDAYADALGVAPTPSPFDEHEWYVDAPETRAW